LRFFSSNVGVEQTGEEGGTVEQTKDSACTSSLYTGRNHKKY